MTDEVSLPEMVSCNLNIPKELFETMIDLQTKLNLKDPGEVLVRGVQALQVCIEIGTPRV